MTSLILTAAIISTLHLEADVPKAGGDYQIVEFMVPAGTVEMEITHSDGSTQNILDYGVWAPEGFRGWGGGLEDAAVIGTESSSRGYLTGPITPGTWQLVIGKAKIDVDPAHNITDITFRDAPTLTPQILSPFGGVVVKTGAAWYRGDFHVHSEQSGDAKATFDQITALARMQHLDFVVLSDHNTVSQHALIATYQMSVPDVLFVRGAEVTTYGGHGNALGVEGYIDHRIGLDNRTSTGIVTDVNTAGGLFIVNHPTLDLGELCIGCAWSHTDTPWDQVGGLEIHNGNYGISLSLFTPGALMLWDSKLDAGARIAPLGGSDDHTAGMNEGPTGSSIGNPTTRVYAEDLSEAAILQAVREGRTLVQLRGPDDPLVELFITGSDGQQKMIGDSVTGDQVTLEAHVTGGDGHTLALVKNGVEGTPVPVAGATFSTTFMESPSAAGDRYRLHLYTPTPTLLVVTGHVRATGTGTAIVDGGIDGLSGDAGSVDAASPDLSATADLVAGSDRAVPLDHLAGNDAAVKPKSGGGGCTMAAQNPSQNPGADALGLLALLGLSLLAARRRRGRA